MAVRAILYFYYYGIIMANVTSKMGKIGGKC